eukprot:CFRG5851T1
MCVSDMNDCPMECNHYETLDVTMSSSPATIRSSYQRLILIHHPDKASKSHPQTETNNIKSFSSEDSINGSNEANFFMRIQAAYAVLRDPEQKRVYDAQLSNVGLRQAHPGNGELDLDDMDYDEEEDTFIHSCRCGGEYMVSGQELEDNMDVVQCSQCSLSVRILYTKQQ